MLGDIGRADHHLGDIGADKFIGDNFVHDWFLPIKRMNPI